MKGDDECTGRNQPSAGKSSTGMGISVCKDSELGKSWVHSGNGRLSRDRTMGTLQAY